MSEKKDPITTADNLREVVAALIEAGIYTTEMLNQLLMPLYNAEVEAGRMSDERAGRIGAIADQMQGAMHEPERLRCLYVTAFEELTERKFLQRRKSLDDISGELSPHNAALWANLQTERNQFEEAIRAGRGTPAQIESGRKMLADMEQSFLDNVQKKRQLKKLDTDLESDLARKKLTPQRAARLRAVLAEAGKILDAPLDDSAEVIRARNEQYREILASLTGALANPGAKRIYNDGTRAHALSRFLSDLKTAFIEEIVRPGILAGEKSVLDRAGTPVVTAEAELEKRCGNDDAIGLETEIVRASALELKQYRRRHHLMVIAPVWQAPRSAVQDPNAVFFSGPPAQQTLVQSVCKSRALTLLPGQRAGTASAAFRWQQLWTANVAMFDLSGYDSSNPIPSSVQVASACYELGIAFALGRSVVTLAHEGQAMPFDVDVAPLCLGGGDGDATALGEAIDAALYATQRGAGISSLHATLDYARKILTGKQEWIDGESATDPVHVNRLLQHALAESGLRGQLAVLPAWPGAYPDPASPRCFHVMAFRSEFNWTVDVVSRICGEHGINYVRGDRVLEPDIIRSIWEEICRATHVIVDVTGSNPNVLLELGIAHTLGRNVLIVSQEKSSIGAVPSLAKLRTHLYSEQASPDAGSLALVVGDFLTAQAKR